MLFWVTIGVVLAVAVGLMALTVFNANQSDAAQPVELRFYKTQLSEIERDVERGLILPQEAERLKTEISRRILKVADHLGSKPPSELSKTWTIVAFVFAAALLAGGSITLYSKIGASGYQDMSRASRIAYAQELRKTRPSYAEAISELGYSQNEPTSETNQALVTQLRETVARRPEDAQGHALLARVEAGLQNFHTAGLMQKRVIEIKGDAATIDELFDHADLMILAANGYVSPEAEKVLNRVLRRDPTHQAAQYYLGLMLAQNARPDQAFEIWNRLLRSSPQTSAWIEPIREQIEDLALAAGITNFELPPLAPAIEPNAGGPSAADVKAAEALSAQERMDMIKGMVSNLSQRLAEDGGPVTDWAKLIRALSVLGQREQALEIYKEAKDVFAQVPRDLEILQEAAKGVALLP